MLKEIVIILIFVYMGDLITLSLSLPVSGSIIGMFLLFFTLLIKVVKLEKIINGGNLLLRYMIIFFIPAGVSLIDSLDKLDGNIIKVIIMIVLTTIITLGVTAKSIDLLIRRR